MDCACSVSPSPETLLSKVPELDLARTVSPAWLISGAEPGAGRVPTPDASAWGAPGKGPAGLGNQGLAAPRGHKPKFRPYLPARSSSPGPPLPFHLFAGLLPVRKGLGPRASPPPPRAAPSLPEPAPPRKPGPSIPVCGWKRPLSCQVTGKSALGSPGEPGAEEMSWSSCDAGLPRLRPVTLPEQHAQGLRTETSALPS